jgi:hypothetical protein
VLRDFVSENVEMVRNPLGVLRFFQVTRRARAKLEARRQALQSQYVFQREERACLGVVYHGEIPWITPE